MPFISLDDVDILARTIYGEGRGETFEAKVAIARTIVNRWKTRKWFSGQTLKAVALMRFQYSAWNESDPNREKMLSVDYSSTKLRECMRAAMDAIDGKGPPWIDNVTHYYNPSVVKEPKWAVGKTPAGRLGAHLFFAGID